jgi:2'-5' RNA ligase
MTDVTTALTLVIPEEFHDKINIIRSKYDKAAVRWMPHINFLFPFVPLHQFEMVGVAIEKELKLNNITSFNMTLDDIGYFKQKGEYTIHLKGNNNSDIIKLNTILCKALVPLGIKSKHAVFNPHLTIAQCKVADFDNMIDTLNLWLSDININFTVDKIHMISRSGDSPFVVKRVINLL